MSAFEQFQSAFEAELNQLWQNVKRKKQEIWELIRDQVKSEKDFRAFFEAYEEHFRPLQARVGELTRLRATLNHRLQGDSVGLYAPEESDPLPEEGESGRTEESSPRLRGGSIRPSASEPARTEERLIPTGRKQIPKGLKAVRDILGWIYNPRPSDHHTQFRKERAQLVNELVSNPATDEVELILRIPFEAEDERLWQEPRDPNRSPVEIQLELYYRYRLFDALLNAALPVAKARAAAEPHPLTAHFLECRRREMPPRAYVLEIDGAIRETIRRLEADVIALQRALKSNRDEEAT